MMAPLKMWAPGSDLFAAARCQLLEMDGGGQAARAAAHHDDVVFHCLARAVCF
jgi:hypothetical protein